MKKRRDIKQQTVIKKRKNLGKKLGKGFSFKCFYNGRSIHIKGTRHTSFRNGW